MKGPRRTTRCRRRTAAGLSLLPRGTPHLGVGLAAMLMLVVPPLRGVAEDADPTAELMALFKTDDVRSQPLSSLETTRELVAKDRRLCGPARAKDSGNQSLARTGKEPGGP